MQKRLSPVKTGLKAIYYGALTFSLFLIHFYALSARSVAEQDIHKVILSLEFENATLYEAFDQLEKASGFHVVYNRGMIDANKRINYIASNKTLAAILSKILGEEYQFNQIENNIVISNKSVPHFREGWGIIQGTITDKDTGDPLIGANIWIDALTTGTTTNISGDYRLEQVPEGTYVVMISYIGYITQTIRDVQVNQKEVTKMDISLAPSVMRLSDVVVEGTIDVKNVDVQNTTELEMIDQIKTSNLIVTGISNEQIIRSLDFNASEVVQRAPGVTVVNDFINIRGLNERYNLVFLDDMIAPSSESDKRAFSFDMLPSNVIDQVLIYRSPAPELPGDFAGGIVRVETKKSVPARQIQLNVSSQYRQGTTFDNVYSSNGGDTDWLGFDDGTRELPSSFPGRGGIPNVFLSGSDLSGTLPQTIADNAGVARQINNDWSLISDDFRPDQRVNLNYYDSWKMGNTRLNNLTAAFYSREHRAFERQSQVGPDGAGYGNIYTDSLSQIDTWVGAMQNLNLMISDHTTIEFNNFFNNVAEDRTIVRDGVDKGGPRSTQDTVRNVQFYWEERMLYSGQLTATHEFGQDIKHWIKGGGGYSFIQQNIPNQRQFQVRRNANLAPGINQVFLTAEQGAEGFEYNLLNFQETNEYTQTYFLDYKLELPNKMHVKVGGFAELKERDFDNRFITIRPTPETIYGEAIPITGPNREFIMSDLFAPGNFQLDGSGLLIGEESLEGSSYNATNDMFAGYIGIFLPFLNDRLSVYAGTRYEYNELKLRTALVGIIQDDSSNVDQLNRFWLPSVNLQYKLADDMVIRAAYGKTLNRPQFRELSIFNYFDFDLNANVRGNQNLIPAEIHNFDLRWEYYPGPGEWISAGIFYKDFSNPIESYSLTTRNSIRENLVPFNSQSAESYGVEVEVRKNLSFLPIPQARHFSLLANFAWLDNEADVDTTIFVNFSPDLIESGRPLQGSSNLVVNASLVYDNKLTGTTANLQYNVFGQRLFLSANGFVSDIYEMPRHLLDFNVKQRIGRNFEVQAGVKNILNQLVRFYRDFVRDEEYDPDEPLDTSVYNLRENGSDYYFRRFEEGRYYSLGVNYIFR